jgi:hypothetical protein
MAIKVAKSKQDIACVRDSLSDFLRVILIFHTLNHRFYVRSDK